MKNVRRRDTAVLGEDRHPLCLNKAGSSLYALGRQSWREGTWWESVQRASCPFTSAAAAKGHTPGGFEDRNYVLTIPEAKGARSGCPRVRFLLGPQSSWVAASSRVPTRSSLCTSVF